MIKRHDSFLLLLYENWIAIVVVKSIGPGSRGATIEVGWAGAQKEQKLAKNDNNA